MKRIILMLLLAGLMAPAGLYAQRVYKDAGKIILDLTTAAGMPAGASTAVSKTAVLNAFTPNNYAGPFPGNAYDGTINATVYQKLEIIPHDMNVSGVVTTTGIPGTFTMTWAEAYNKCRALNYNGTGWRLPTQREIFLMYVFFKSIAEDPAKITALGMTPFTSDYYWSATESYLISGGVSYVVELSFGTGMTHHINKAGGNKVRCVREVAP